MSTHKRSATGQAAGPAAGGNGGAKGAGDLALQVKVRPDARSAGLEEPGEAGIWRARVKAPPVEGKDHAELVGLIAARFGCPRSAVSIRTGGSARIKRVRIAYG
jgi:uncharacterized protein YggU (UPF0235/DUF167 family)